VKNGAMVRTTSKSTPKARAIVSFRSDGYAHNRKAVLATRSYEIQHTWWNKTVKSARTESWLQRDNL